MCDRSHSGQTIWSMIRPPATPKHLAASVSQKKDRYVSSFIYGQTSSHKTTLAKHYMTYMSHQTKTFTIRPKVEGREPWRLRLPFSESSVGSKKTYTLRNIGDFPMTGVLSSCFSVNKVLLPSSFVSETQYPRILRFSSLSCTFSSMSRATNFSEVESAVANRFT